MIEKRHRIIFDLPDIPALIQNHTVVDMHVHSKFSDGHNTIEEIAAKAKQLNIGVAITDHNMIQGAIDIDAYDSVLSIPGIEVTSKEGSHVLIYFYTIKDLKLFYEHDIEPFMGSEIMSSIALGMEEILFKAKAYKSLVIFAHPYCAGYTGIENLHFTKEQLSYLYQMADGVEVINSENLKKWNYKSALLGFNLDKGITGGSDSHSLYQIGRVVTYADCKHARKAFIDAIKNRRSYVIGKEINILRKVTSNSYKLKTNFRNYPNLVEKNFKYGYTAINSKSKSIKNNVKAHFSHRKKRHDLTADAITMD